MLKKILFLLGAVLFVAACSNPTEPVVTTDTEAPTIGTFTVPASTESESVTITLEAQDNTAVTGYALSVQDRSSSAPDAPAADSDLWHTEVPSTVSLPQGEFGAYSIYAWTRDAAGNVSEPAVRDIDYRNPVVPDTEAPQITNFTVPATSNSLTPAVSVTATDNFAVSGYYITHVAQGNPAPADPAVDHANWVSVAPTDYTLPADGNYTLYLWTKDSSGNISTSSQADISADSTVPSVSTFSLALAVSGNGDLDLTISASDASTISGYYVSTSSQTPSLSDAGWQASAPTTFSNTDFGNLTLYLWVKDSFGNIANEQATIARNYNSIILYYGAADNDLELYLYADMNEMEMVDTSAAGIKTIALFDRGSTFGSDFTGDGNWTSTRAYEIGYDPDGFDMTLDASTQRIAIPGLGITTTNNVELSMDSPNTLSAFVQFGMDSYPSDNYILIMSNHGGGWRDDEDKTEERVNAMAVDKAICWDDTSGVNESLYMNEVRTAIGNNKLDLLAFDACLMGMAEVVYELRNSANYIVASQEVIPGVGFPYYQLMTAYNATPQATMVEVGTAMVDSYISAYTNGTNIELPGLTADDITLTLYDTSHAASLATAVSSLGNELIINYDNADPRFSTLSMANPEFADLGDYLSEEAAGANQAATSTAAVLSALSNLIVYHGAPSTGPYSASTGLAIYFPILAANPTESDYNNLNIQFASAAGGWEAFVHNLAPTTSTIDPLELEAMVQVGGIDLMSPDPANPLMNPNTVTAATWNANDTDQFLIQGNTPTDICTIQGEAGTDYGIAYVPFDNTFTPLVTDPIFVDAGGIGAAEVLTLDYPSAVIYMLIVTENPATHSLGDTYTVTVSTP